MLNAPSTGQPGSSYAMDILLTPHGGTVKGAVLSLDGTNATVTCNLTHDRVCRLGKLSYSQHVAITVSVPSSFTKGTVTVTAYVKGTNTTQEFQGSKNFTVKPKPKPKPTPTNSAKPTSSHSSGSGSSGGSGSGSSSGSNPSTLSSGSLNPGTAGANTAPSTAPQNNAVLPTIPPGQQTPTDQAPTTAPLIENTGNSQSMRNAADGPGELTFDKLASTQAAWLAALLVAFSLLLTQVRLGKAGTRGAKAVAKPKGAHRKPNGRLRRRAY